MIFTKSPVHFKKKKKEVKSFLTVIAIFEFVVGYSMHSALVWFTLTHHALCYIHYDLTVTGVIHKWDMTGQHEMWFNKHTDSHDLSEEVDVKG